MRFLPFLLLLITACGLPAPTHGTRVADGVAQANFSVRVRHTDLVGVSVFFPADSNGVPTAHNLPALVMIPGGFVPAKNYSWMGEAFAAKGFVIAIAEQAGDLAFFSIENGNAARSLLRAPPDKTLLQGLVNPNRIAVAGHSLGGVVAVEDAIGADFQALALFASYPSSGDDADVAKLGIPSISIAGEKDCDAKLATVTSGWSPLPSPSVLAVIQGMTHYQWTDDDAHDRKGCPPGITLDEAHQRATHVLTDFLNAALAVPSTGTGVAEIRNEPGLLSVDAR